MSTTELSDDEGVLAAAGYPGEALIADDGAPIAAIAAEPGLLPTLAVATASQVLATSSVLALATISPIVSASLGISSYLVGYQVSLIYCAGIFASAIAGGLVKRHGSARIAQMALFGAGVGFLGLATGILPVMLVASALIGIGYALNNPASSHILRRVTPPKLRNLVYSIKQAGVPVGGILAALVIPPLSAATDWRFALLVAAAPPLLLGAVFLWLRPSWDVDADPKAPIVSAIIPGQITVWSSPGLRALAVLGLLYSAIQLCVSTFTVAMLVSEFHWPLVRAAAAVAIVQAFGAFGRIAWGLVADLIGSGLLVLAFLGAMTGICCIALHLTVGAPPLWTMLVLCVLGACAVGWNGVMLAETARLSPGKAGTLTGDVLVYTFLGVMFGPASFAALYPRIGTYTGAFLILAALGFLGMVLALVAARSVGKTAG